MCTNDYLSHNPNNSNVGQIKGGTSFTLELMYAMAHVVDTTDHANPLMPNSQSTEAPNHLINPLES